MRNGAEHLMVACGRDSRRPLSCCPSSLASPTSKLIPSLELLFDLHALTLVMLVAMRPRMHVLLLVYAGAAWLMDARSAALVALTAQGLQVLQPHLETNGFRTLAGMLTAVGVVVLLGAPWAQRNLSHDSAFEQSRADGFNTTMPAPQGDAFIEGSLAERVDPMGMDRSTHRMARSRCSRMAAGCF